MHPVHYKEPDLNQLIDEALLQRPEIRNMKAGISGSRQQIRAARGGYYPTVSAKAYMGWETIWQQHGRGWLIGMTLDWDFFPGLSTVGEVREAKAELLNLKAQMRQLELDVIEEVTQSLLILNEKAASIEAARVAVKWARENYKLAAGRYAEGLGNAIEFADAVLSLVEDRSLLVRTIYDYHKAKAALDHSIGRGYGYL